MLLKTERKPELIEFLISNNLTFSCINHLQWFCICSGSQHWNANYVCLCLSVNDEFHHLNFFFWSFSFSLCNNLAKYFSRQHNESFPVGVDKNLPTAAASYRECEFNGTVAGLKTNIVLFNQCFTNHVMLNGFQSVSCFPLWTQGTFRVVNHRKGGEETIPLLFCLLIRGYTTLKCLVILCCIRAHMSDL